MDILSSTYMAVKWTRSYATRHLGPFKYVFVFWKNCFPLLNERILKYYDVPLFQKTETFCINVLHVQTNKVLWRLLVCWNRTSCNMIDRYQRFGDTCYFYLKSRRERGKIWGRKWEDRELLYPEYGGSKFLRNVSNDLAVYVASHASHRREIPKPHTEAVQMWVWRCGILHVTHLWFDVTTLSVTRRYSGGC